MTQKLLIPLASLLIVVVAASSLLSHCQILCGIYDDSARFTLSEEHVTTIEKSMNEIERLSKELHFPKKRPQAVLNGQIDVS